MRMIATIERLFGIRLFLNQRISGKNNKEMNIAITKGMKIKSSVFNNQKISGITMISSSLFVVFKVSMRVA